MNLNAEQEQAVQHFDGPCMVTAIPGSGKTKVLTERVSYLVKNHNVDPSSILCITFTNKAAKEMKERVAVSLGQRAGQVWISTFHSFCLAILRKYGEHVHLRSNFSVYSEKDQIEVLSKICRMNEFEINPWGVKSLAKTINDYREDINNSEYHIESLLPIEKDIVKEYLLTLDSFNAVDFSGILYKTWELFQKKPKSTEKLAIKFRYILVDEMQDTNAIQYEIVRAIADPSKKREGNLFVVGDPNQSIFSWRMACPENINKLKEDFDDVTEIILRTNYRSTSQILEAAQRLIRNNTGAAEVELESHKGEGVEVQINDHDTPEIESHRIAETIKSLREQYNYKWSDFAILYRANHLSKTPEMVLRQADIPYRIVGGFSFFDRAEIKTALAYLSFYVNPYDTIAFERVMKYQSGVGSTTIGRLERFCQENEISMVEACDRIDEIEENSGKKFPIKSKKALQEFVKVIKQCPEFNIFDVASYLLNETGYYTKIEEESLKDEKSFNRVENLNEFLTNVSDFQNSTSNATIGGYLHSVSLMTDYGKDDENEDAVDLMTIHRSKGLEYPVVFIVGVEEGTIPHKLSVQEGNIEEERRLLFVGTTRAMGILYLNYCSSRTIFSKYQKGTRNMPCHPSRFFLEIEEPVCI